MNKIYEKFEELKNKKEIALIAYVCAGDPNYEKSKEIVKILKKHCDIIEIGLPFSDPIADGVTIQKASDRAIKAGMNTDVYFKFCKELNEDLSFPFICMTYYNLIFKYGIEKFVKKCKKLGIYGLIVPDLPVEESDELLKFCNDYGINLIFLISQTSTEERIKKIVEKSSGFIYLISLLGVTGAREKLSIDKNFIERVRKVEKNLNKNIPLAIGFGISKEEHIKEIKEMNIDGVIVGSAIIDKYMENLNNLNKFEEFVKNLKEACK
ncbi:MAG: tryptophan synthase subunit alpha [Candidatus Altarchaeaceae archaeon]